MRSLDFVFSTALVLIWAITGAAWSAVVAGGDATPLPWDSSTDVRIGDIGGGTLVADQGAQLAAGRAEVGYGPAATGSATVAGAGSLWTVDGTLLLGDDGTGSLRIEAGGRVSSAAGWIADGASAVGEAIVTGSGSRWDVAGTLEVGNRGSGRLTISHGALVTVGGQLMIDEASSRIDSYVDMAAGGMLAIAGYADSRSIVEFLYLVGGTDAIRYWDAVAGTWAPITDATYGADYSIDYFDAGELAGYSLLTVGTVPEPAAVMLAGLGGVAAATRFRGGRCRAVRRAPGRSGGGSPPAR